MPRTPGRLCCQRLREAAVRLLERGLSVEEVASLLGVSERTVRRWASGKAAAAVDKAAVAVEKSKDVQRAVRRAVEKLEASADGIQKAGGGGAVDKSEAAERRETPPVDNVWVAILRRRQLGAAGGAADINTQCCPRLRHFPPGFAHV
ncbi:helix-turn-helix domain-containing protein [Pyrobaculum sp.]|uniref:helix-turn-helix domain-containing protein n=1 Tax=Pyrobaculum sp. TaxID=2004705 RepID=UPI003D09D08D